MYLMKETITRTARVYGSHFGKYKLDRLGPAWVPDNPQAPVPQWLALSGFCRKAEHLQILQTLQTST